jgi:hypothetical protein
MTRKEISKALPFWKSVLKLEDWTIDVVTGKKEELIQDDGDGPEEHEALNHITPEHMESHIVMCWGAKEETLVHELLHLVHDGDKPLGPYDVLHERALNRVADALMFLKGEK